MTHPTLKPFWQYYGGKWRAAPRYPEPLLRTIVEPFAGAAGYSMRYPDRNVILVEKYHVIAEIWRWLIAAPEREILSVPCVDSVDELPSGTAQGAKFLVGFTLNAATTRPNRNLSSGRAKMRAAGRHFEGWTEARRQRVASQVQHIRHWQIIEGDYTSAPDVLATWFVDPPYNNKAGSCYVEHSLDYNALAAWSRSRAGQRIVCENEGADWLPFRSFGAFRQSINGAGSREVIWP